MQTIHRLFLDVADGKRDIESALDELERNYGGSMIYVPSGEVARTRRDRAIRQLSAEGIAVKNIAVQFGLSERRVQEIVKFQ